MSKIKADQNKKAEGEGFDEENYLAYYFNIDGKSVKIDMKKDTETSQTSNQRTYVCC